jgi:hypothetical protein
MIEHMDTPSPVPTQPAAPSTPVPAIPRRRWWLRCVLTLAVLFLGVVGVIFYLDDRVRRDWAAAEAETDQLDPGWRLEEMEADRPGVPDHENAALLINAVAPKVEAAHLFDVPRYDEIFSHLPPTSRLNRQQTDLIRAEFAKVPEIEEMPRKLKKMPNGRFTLKYSDGYYDTDISPLQRARIIAAWLKHEAYLLAEDDNRDQALESCEAILNIGRIAGDEGYLLSYYIRAALQEDSIGTLERVLAQGDISDNSLRAMQAHLEKEASQSNWLRAIRGERAGHYRLFVSFRNGTLKENPIFGPAKPASVSEWIHGTFPKTLLKYFPEDLRFMNQAVEIAKLPIHERRPKLDEWHAVAQGTANPIIKRLAPALIRVDECDHRSQGLLRSAAVAMACERYRMKHDRGEWPTSLEVLVQEKLLDAVPADPISNQPLRYRRKKDHIVIYSIGVDGVDNQGHIERHDIVTLGGTDIGFRLWDKEHRGAPPRPLVVLPEAQP